MKDLPTRPISVLFDARGISGQHVGGVSGYFAEIIKRFPGDVRWQIASSHSNSIYFQSPPFNMLPLRREITAQDFIKNVLHGHNIRGVSRFFRILRRWSPSLVHADAIIAERKTEALARSQRVDLIHFTEPHNYSWNWRRAVGNKPFVLTIHDLIPELLCGRTDIATMRKPVLDAAAGIIAVSQYTKARVVELYNVSPCKISVIYHGHLGHPATGMPPLFPGKKYILYVGRRKEPFDYKNFPFFIRSIAPLLAFHRDLFLVCTGKPFEEYDAQLFKDSGIADKVLHCFISDAQFPNLFAQAEMFIYPSKMEGFGIPILDAFEAGCPVILSNCSCFPEIAGDAALYFNDGDAEGLRHAVKTIMEHKNVRDDLIARGKQRVRYFSWEKCAKETVEFYKKVLAR